MGNVQKQIKFFFYIFIHLFMCIYHDLSLTNSSNSSPLQCYHFIVHVCS